MTTLGQRIREHRRRAGMSQEALARRMDVSRQAVTKWESGQSAPSTENLFRLAELFHTTVDLLLPPGEASPAASARPRPDWRHRAEMAGLVLAGYLIFYLLGRVLWCPMEGSSLLGWLVWNRPDGDGSYLYGWLLSSGLFWWAMALSVLTALLGRYRLSLVTCAYSCWAFSRGSSWGLIRQGLPWATATTAGPAGVLPICCPSPWGCWQSGHGGRACRSAAGAGACWLRGWS